jgi:hypothetical protein
MASMTYLPRGIASVLEVECALRQTADDMVATGVVDWDSAYQTLKRLTLPSLKASEEIRQLGIDIVSGIADGVRSGSLPHTRTPRREKRRTRKRRR